MGILLSTGLAAAEPAVFLSPSAGETLQGGQVVEVRFEGVPRDVDEMELLLIAGADRAIAFRVTEMLDPTTRSFAWTVPNLVLPQAALILRMGDDELEHEAEPSAVFAIEPSPALAVARLDYRHGELWVSDGSGETSASYSLPGTAMTPTGDACVDRGDHPSGGILREPLSGDSEEIGPGVAAPSQPAAASPDSVSHAFSRVPRDVPRRI